MNSMQPSTVKSFGVLHLGNEMTHFRQATFNRPSWKYLSVLHNVTFSKRLFVFLVSMNSIHCDQLYCFDAFNMRALKTLLNWPRFALLTISHIRSTFTVKNRCVFKWRDPFANHHLIWLSALRSICISISVLRVPCKSKILLSGFYR